MGASPRSVISRNTLQPLKGFSKRFGPFRAGRRLIFPIRGFHPRLLKVLPFGEQSQGEQHLHIVLPTGAVACPRPCLFRPQPVQALGKSLAVSDGRKLFLKTGESRKSEIERLREVANVMFVMDGKLLERFHSKGRLAPRKLQP